MWARPDLRSTFDLLMVLSAIVLTILAGRWGRLRLWEGVAIAGMAVATVSSARHGMWLLMFLLGPVALALSRVARRGVDRPRSPLRALNPVGLVALAVVIGLCAVSLTKREAVLRGPEDLIRTVAAEARGRVVLAPEPLAEDLAAAGVTVWAANPIDAFARSDQVAYLAFMGGDAPRARTAFEGSQLVVAAPDSAAARSAATSGFTEGALVDGYTLFLRR